MQRGLALPRYANRFIAGGFAVTITVLLLAAIITAAGVQSAFAAGEPPAKPIAEVSGSDTPNAITVGMHNMSANISYRVNMVGVTAYNVCRSIATGTATAAHAVGEGFALAGKTVGQDVLAVLRTPSSLIRHISHPQTVSAMIQPTASAPMPKIDAKTTRAAYEQMSLQQRTQITQFLDEQLAANRALASTVVAGDTLHGGYPANWDNAPQDSSLDAWGMYNRECVSYAAWKVHQAYGTMPDWGGIGNANQWVRNAQAAGIPTSSIPHVGSVAISMAGYYGHAMWVEKVAGDMIYISQYNYDLNGHYSEMWVSSRNLTFIYFS